MHRRSMLVALACALAMSAAPAPSPAAAGDTPIQPGARITRPAGCTLNFVFTDAQERLYIGTAAHCVRGVGDRVRSSDSTVGDFGTVVERMYSDWTYQDFALIEIDPEHYAIVNPSMRRWGGPTGYATQAQPLDPVAVHGHGMIFGSTEQTRSRAGVLRQFNPYYFSAEAPVIFGDSGGAAVNPSTGEAIGVVTRIQPPYDLLRGPTIQSVLTDLAALGRNVSLVLAPN